jgi:hypothetical protein
LLKLRVDGLKTFLARNAVVNLHQKTYIGLLLIIPLSAFREMSRRDQAALAQEPACRNMFFFGVFSYIASLCLAKAMGFLCRHVIVGVRRSAPDAFSLFFFHYYAMQPQQAIFLQIIFGELNRCTFSGVVL